MARQVRQSPDPLHEAMLASPEYESFLETFRAEFESRPNTSIPPFPSSSQQGASNSTIDFRSLSSQSVYQPFATPSTSTFPSRTHVTSNENLTQSPVVTSTQLQSDSQRRSIRQSSRANLFQPYSRTPGSSRVVSTPRPFPVKVVLLPDFMPAVRPSFPKIRELSSLGFGEHVVMFEESDSPLSVFNKIYQAFPILRNIMGGIQMFGQTATRYSTEIEPFISAVLSGAELKGQKRVFVTRMLAEESFPEENRRLDIPMTCPKCLEQHDLSEMRQHHNTCQWISNDIALAAASQLADAGAGLPSTPAEPAPAAAAAAAASAAAAAAASAAAAAAAAQHSSKEAARRILQGHKLIYNINGSRPNKWTFTRSNIMDNAIAATLDEGFMSNIHRKLVCKFLEELGIDLGGVSRQVLSIILTCIEESFEMTNQLYENPNGQVEGETLLDAEYIRNRLYCFGVFSGLSVMQHDLCPEFVLTWVDRLSATPDHPFLMGLRIFFLPQLIFSNPEVRLLFAPTTRDVDTLLSLFKIGHSEVAQFDYQLEQLETCSYGHFQTFLRRLIAGQVVSHSGPVSVKQLYQFATGLWILPATPLSQIVVRFVSGRRGELPRPTAMTCSLVLTLPLTTSPEEMERAWVAALDEGGHQFHRA